MGNTRGRVKFAGSEGDKIQIDERFATGPVSTSAELSLTPSSLSRWTSELMQGRLNAPSWEGELTGGTGVVGGSAQGSYDDLTGETTLQFSGSVAGVGADLELVLDRNGEIISSNVFGGGQLIGGGKFAFRGLPIGAEGVARLGLRASADGLSFVVETEASVGVLIGEFDYNFTQEVELFRFADKCFLAGTPITMADGSEKPIEAVRPDDWVMSFDRDGKKTPGRVTRTFRNEAKIVLDFHGTFVTPGHVYYCAGGTFAGQFVPLIDILRDDGIVQHEDGRLIRATTGCEVGSDNDRQFWAFLVSEEADGTERVRDKCQLRFGSRVMLPDGRHFSMRDYLDGIGVEIIESGPYEGYARFRKTGLITVFAWTLSDRLPKPEDFILQRSGTTLSDIYRASEWEAAHPRMAAPVALESGPVQPLSSCEHAASPRNMPLALAGHGASSTLQLNRKARKAAAAKERREGRSRKRLH